MNIPLNIDWQQILLHVLNFVILFGGLYFLYDIDNAGHIYRGSKRAMIDTCAAVDTLVVIYGSLASGSH